MFYTSFIISPIFWERHAVFPIHHKSLYGYILNGNFSKLCMFAYYHIKIHMSVRLYDRTIFEAVIVHFSLWMLHQIVCMGNSSYILNGNSSLLVASTGFAKFMNAQLLIVKQTYLFAQCWKNISPCTCSSYFLVNNSGLLLVVFHFKAKCFLLWSTISSLQWKLEPGEPYLWCSNG